MSKFLSLVTVSTLCTCLFVATQPTSHAIGDDVDLAAASAVHGGCVMSIPFALPSCGAPCFIGGSGVGGPSTGSTSCPPFVGCSGVNLQLSCRCGGYYSSIAGGPACNG